MTVDDLRKAIADVSGDCMVLITMENDEFAATSITGSRSYLRICEKNTGMTSAETMLHADPVAVMEEEP